MQVLKEKLQETEIPRFHAVALRLSLHDETHIAEALQGISQLHSSVSMGSYPVSGLPGFKDCSIHLCNEDYAPGASISYHAVPYSDTKCSLKLQDSPK